MHNKIDISAIITAVIFTALAIIFPIIFHIVGPGAVFLPMYIPLTVGAYLMKPSNALMMGIFTPLLSAIVTGMPPFYPPIAFTMSIQLGIMCFTISFLNHRFKSSIMASLIPSLLFERIIMAILYLLILPQFNVNGAIYTVHGLLKGLPGIILILIITPLAVPRSIAILNKNSLQLFENKMEKQ